MSSNQFNWITIEDSVIEIIDGDRGKNYPKRDEFANDGFCLFLNAGNVTPRGFEFDQVQFITKEKDSLLRKGKLTRNDIVLTTRGTVGNVGFYDKSVDFDNIRINSGMVILRLPSNQNQIDTEFLYHYLRSTLFQDQVMSHISGSAQPQLPIRDLKEIFIVCPTLMKQKRIAGILSALDEKIELNRQTNATLEAIAQAIFKEWFVHYNYPGATGEFVESELGLIPAGWRVGKLGDIAIQRNERINASPETENLPYVPIDVISPHSLFLSDSKSGSDAKTSLIRFYRGDILFGAMRSYFHKVCIAPFDGTTRTTAFVLHPRLESDFSFMTMLIHQPTTIDYASKHSTGSTIPYAQWNASLAEMPIVMPTSVLRSRFNDLVAPLLNAIHPKYYEIRTLAQIRDTLLPKLMRGEIEV